MNDRPLSERVRDWDHVLAALPWDIDDVASEIAALEDENKRLLDALERIVASHPTKPGVHPRSIATAALMAERMLEGGE